MFIPSHLPIQCQKEQQKNKKEKKKKENPK